MRQFTIRDGLYAMVAIAVAFAFAISASRDPLVIALIGVVLSLSGFAIMLHWHS